MTPHLSQRLLVLSAALAAAAFGCGPPRARSFAVRLSEPAASHCLPSLAGSSEGFAAVVEAWVSAFTPVDEAPPEPAGGSARLAPADEAGLAWFEGFQGSPYDAWNGVVFEGDVHDDYLDVSIEGSRAAEDPACGEPLAFEASFVGTIDGTRLDGLVRRKEQQIFSGGDSACVLAVCFRRIAVTGVEEP